MVEARKVRKSYGRLEVLKGIDLTVGQYYVERHYARGAARQLPPTPFQRLRRALGHTRTAPVPALPEAPWVAPHD